MYLRAKKRFKDGKEHRYWSIVESCRQHDGRVAQRQVLYLGEINDSDQAAWCKSIEVLQGDSSTTQMTLFPTDRSAPPLACDVVQVKLNELQLHHPRQWGACWLVLALWNPLDLDSFWRLRLPASRQGTKWLNVLKTQVCYQLIDPGSEWRLHRHWYEHSAMGDLLGSSDRVLQDDTLYRCLDKLLAHKRAFFSFLRAQWSSLFAVRFDVLVYDLTSTCFESDAPFAGKRQFGYSRDKRGDCVQMVIALVVTPEGFPLAYEVMPGNTSDKTTLADFMTLIEEQYGQSDRIWIMDRGIPTEDTLSMMRSSEQPIHYLVGTPKGCLTRLEQAFLDQPWQQVREAVDVKLLEQDQELYVLARSQPRILKERGMRRRRLKRRWQRLHELRQQTLTRDQLLIKLGAAKKEAGRAYYLVDIQLPAVDQVVSSDTFTFSLRRDKLRMVRRREGRYLLRSNLRGEDPATLWQYYIRLTEIEQAFKELKHDLGIRPIFHQTDARIEAHIFIAFIAYSLQVTLKHQLRSQAPGLTPKAVLEKFATMQMVDVHLPTTDGRQLVLPRYTQPGSDHQLLLQYLKLRLPTQPTPRITDKIS